MSDWLADVERALALAEGGHGRVILLVANRFAHLKPLMQLLERRADQTVELRTCASDLREQPTGATVPLILRRQDLRWLNRNRPLIAERKLTLLVNARPDAAARLPAEAPDFFDWIALRTDVDIAPMARTEPVADRLLDAFDVHAATRELLDPAIVTVERILAFILATEDVSDAIDDDPESSENFVGQQRGRVIEVLLQRPELRRPVRERLDFMKHVVWLGES